MYQLSITSVFVSMITRKSLSISQASYNLHINGFSKGFFLSQRVSISHKRLSIFQAS